MQAAWLRDSKRNKTWPCTESSQCVETQTAGSVHCQGTVKAPRHLRGGTILSTVQWEGRVYTVKRIQQGSKEEWQAHWALKDDSELSRRGSRRGGFLVHATTQVKTQRLECMGALAHQTVGSWAPGAACRVEKGIASIAGHCPWMTSYCRQSSAY